jgi:hypothetical protein
VRLCETIGGRKPNVKEAADWKVTKRAMDRKGTYEAFLKKLVDEHAS